MGLINCRFARLIAYDSTMILFLPKFSLIFSQLFLRLLWLTNIIASDIVTLQNHRRNPYRHPDVWDASEPRNTSRQTFGRMDAQVILNHVRHNISVRTIKVPFI